MYWSEFGPTLSLEAVGLTDPSLPTVAVYAKFEPLPENETSPKGENVRELILVQYLENFISFIMNVIFL